jgi:PEP-CTERM motif
LNTKSLFYIPLMLMMPLLVEAGTVWNVGTPANAYSLPPTTKPTPYFGSVLVNFDSLTACGTFPPSGCTNVSGNTYANDVTITSGDGLYVIPYSSQSAPNELYDNSSDGSANLTISLSYGANAVGVGVADSDDPDGTGDPVNIFLQALNVNGNPLGAADEVTLPETGSNPGNGYFYVTDTTDDIYGIQITQPVGDTGVYSGLAIDDVQAAPEPSTWLLLIGGGLAMIGGSRLRKKA